MESSGDGIDPLTDHRLQSLRYPGSNVIGDDRGDDILGGIESLLSPRSDLS